jgi:hypothetical protein
MWRLWYGTCSLPIPSFAMYDCSHLPVCVALPCLLMYRCPAQTCFLTPAWAGLELLST